MLKKNSDPARAIGTKWPGLMGKLKFQTILVEKLHVVVSRSSIPTNVILSRIVLRRVDTRYPFSFGTDS